MGKFEETLGINELKSKNNNIWRALLAEFLGNLLLNFFGCASCVALGPPGPNLVLIALTFGLTIFVVVQVSNVLHSRERAVINNNKKSVEKCTKDC